MVFDIKIVVCLEPCSKSVSGFALDLRTSNIVTLPHKLVTERSTEQKLQDWNTVITDSMSSP